MDKTRQRKKVLTRHKLFLLAAFLVLWPAARAMAIENSECMECHSDSSLTRQKSQGMKESLFVDDHKFKFSVHNINGVGCVDCHADIKKLDMSADVPHSTTLAPVNCDSCHDAQAEAYQNSVHRKAGGKGITIPCYACHDYHYVTYLEGNSVLERENAFCLKCHNPNNFHEWLPQKETHFAFVECAVCHAPEESRYVALRFYDLMQERFLTGDEFLKALNTSYEGFMPLVDRNKDGTIDLAELEDMVLLLRQKNVRGTFHGEVVANLTPVVHHVNRGQANGECIQCHNPTSVYFEKVQICLNKNDGTRQMNNVSRDVLASYYVNHFYALSGTRVRLLDKVGIALLAGGFAVVAGHLSARILTAPIRRRRREKEGKSH